MGLDIGLWFLTNCKKKEEINTDYIGTWQLDKVTCNSITKVPNRWTEVITISEGSASAIDAGQKCFSSYNNLSISAGQSSVVMSGGSSNCSPSNCHLTGYLQQPSGAGGSTGVVYNCQSGQPQATTVEYQVSAEGQLYASKSDFVGTCTIYYNRISGSVPTASCLSESYNVRPDT